MNLSIAIDASGSMAGKRINAVKLGLCCLVAALKPTDRVQLVSFSSSISDLTGGFVSVSDLLPMLPSLLVALRAEGSTRFYDTILKCIADLRVQTSPRTESPTSSLSAASSAASSDAVSASASASTVAASRNIVLALTDGEDNTSTASVQAVRLLLRQPAIPTFMFMTVTVDVDAPILQTLSNWSIYSHSKLIEVTCRTGRRLVSVFGETVVERMLREEDEDAGTFFSLARGALLREGCAEPPELPLEATPAPVDGDHPPPYSAISAAGFSLGNPNEHWVTPGAARRVRRMRQATGSRDASSSGSDSDSDMDRVLASSHGTLGVCRSSSPMLDRCLSEEDS